MKLPFQIDLSGKLAVITGAGGVLMSEFARALAASGAKVALLDINEEAVCAVADSIGENALPIATNCLEKSAIQGPQMPAISLFLPVLKKPPLSVICWHR